MAIDGTGSIWPQNLDSWTEFFNGICTNVTAVDFNKIQHATFKLERQSINVLLHGHPASTFQPTVSGDARPKILFKTYTVVVTGADAGIKTLQLSGFTAAEKNLFNGTPLASGNTVIVQIRRVPGNSNKEKSHFAALKGPIADETGDTGVWINASTLRFGDGDHDIGAGTYVVSLMITRG